MILCEVELAFTGPEIYNGDGQDEWDQFRSISVLSIYKKMFI